MVDLVIVIYDRYENLLQWFRCLSQCDTENVRVTVIHNTNEVRYDYQHLCELHLANYIQRPNIGFDIGAFQDVCRGRLKGFPDWQRLLWCTDDTFPMQSDFVKQFENHMGDKVGVACMKISAERHKHIRTTGFMIDRSIAEKLTFQVDPIRTKEHCWQFEHRDISRSFFLQIRRMNLQVAQVAPDAISPMWDVGYRQKVDRQREFDEKFNGLPPMKITFICPIYKGYPQIISSLLTQTNPNWELWLIHDGPGEVEIPNDERIKLTITPEHRGMWGHCYRAEYLQKVETDFVCINNPDNYLMPTFIEYMLRGFKDGIVATYCSHMVHSYQRWAVIECRMERGYVDCGGVVVRSKEAKEVGWNDIEYHSADWLYFNDIIKKFGINSFAKVNGCLLVHN